MSSHPKGVFPMKALRILAVATLFACAAAPALAAGCADSSADN